jgi:hypothetical protein
MSPDSGNKVLIKFGIICDSDKDSYHNPGEYQVHCVHTGTLYCSKCSEFCVDRGKERLILENTKIWRRQVRFELGRKRHCDKIIWVNNSVTLIILIRVF